MKKAIAALVALAIVLLAGFPALARGGEGVPRIASKVREGAEYAPGEILVKFKDGAGAGAAGEARSRAGALVSERLPYTDFDLVRVPPEKLEHALSVLRSSGLVEYAEPNYIRHADYTPTDPDYATYQWNLSQTAAAGGIDMEPAWDTVFAATGNYGGDPSVVVAVLDSGVAYRPAAVGGRSPDFDAVQAHFVQGYDFINRDQYADDDFGHGTHVAGTIVESNNNGLYVTGIAFDCTVMPVKVLDHTGSGTDAEIIQGIRFAADNGADVLNMSLSGPDPNEALRDAIDYAFENGVVVCASAGNRDDSFVDYPAGYPNCIAVGATARTGARASYSNYGSALDVMAPGGDGSLATNRVNQVTYVTEGNPLSGFNRIPKNGTSMASPHVAAVAALVKSVHPTWTSAQVRGTVVMSAQDIAPAGWDRYTGWGRIDANVAVSTASPPGPTGPSLEAVSPDQGSSGSSITITATGSDFSNPVKLTLERIGEAGIGGTGLSQTGSTRIACNLSLSGAQPGLWDVIVEDKAMRSDTLAGGLAVDSADNKTWYLSEGSTDYGFEEYITIQNPSAATANVNVLFMTPGGAQPPQTLSVAPDSRATVTVSDFVPGTDVSAKVTSDQNIICERSMYWNGRIEGTDSIGVQAPSYAWYLAEGTTDYGFDTFLTVQNPTARAATVSVTYLTDEGPVEKDPFTVDANSRQTVNVADDLPASDMSFEVIADQRIICERAMYWDGRRGGHVSVGSNSPAQEWYVCEGSTDWGFTEYLELGNPGAGDAAVDLTYMTPSGPVPRTPLNVPAGSRVTVRVNDDLPGEDISVRAVSDAGIIVERAMYWDNGTGRAGHCAMGVPQPRQENFLAEGTTNWGFDEWVVIQNPNSTACDIGVDYMTSQGPIPTTGFSLPANTRVSLHVNASVPFLDTSAYVYSNLPIIAERAMYWDSRGAGHVSPGLMK